MTCVCIMNVPTITIIGNYMMLNKLKTCLNFSLPRRLRHDVTRKIIFSRHGHIISINYLPIYIIDVSF